MNINISLPSTIDLHIVKFPVYYLAVLVIALITLFAIWLESVKDGFDKEKIFDLFFLFILFLFGLYFLTNYMSFYNYYVEQNSQIIIISSFFVSTLILVRISINKWKWSIYRVLDIFSFLYFCLTVIFIFSKSYLLGDVTNYIFLAIYSVLFLVFYYTRNLTFSGLAFSVYLVLTVAIAQFFLRSNLYLIFYMSLITISIVNLVIRSKSKMSKNKFNFDFLGKIKGLLLSKDKRLKDEQQQLIEEDPYLQEGRDTGNSEEIDEAILEDRAKEESDIKKENIEKMQSQVKKALDKIEEGNYGICEVCGESIDKARLEAYPEATKCLRCSNLEGVKA